MTEYFIQAFIYLLAAVVVVPIAKRLGLGSVLGYLVAGVIIGPIAGLVGDETVTIQHFAEFGVVMMLFLVGLELEPRMLWDMKARLLGLGGLQLGLSTGLIMLIPLAFGQPLTVALAVGLIFSLSSTAIVLQTFAEKGLTRTVGGQSAFSILLFQDMAVIPMLAFLPLLAMPELAGVAVGADDGHHGPSLVDGLPGWAYGAVIVGSIAGLVLGGHYLSRPLFRFVAASGLREVFVATALVLVVGIAALMSLIGLSPALGTFLAGVVLANSEFKHELESNIEPFKGLLLGLFFITVGAGVDFGLLAESAGLIIGLSLGVLVIKSGVLYFIATLFKVHRQDRWLVALSLPQAGEFGFVLLAFAVQQSVMPVETGSLLQMVVALTMFLTPMLFIVYEKVIVPKMAGNEEQREADEIEERGKVIIAGIGRYGQIINRMLSSNGVPTVVLDHEVNQIETLRKFGTRAYFGDATRPELLETAGIEEASVLIVALDDREGAEHMVEYVRHTWPHVHIVARAYDRGHGYRLRKAGAHQVLSETWHSAVETAGMALGQLGLHPYEVEQKKAKYAGFESKASDELYEAWLKTTEGEQYTQNFVTTFLKFEEEMSRDMSSDHMDRHDSTDRHWTPPPKGYAEKFADED